VDEEIATLVGAMQTCKINIVQSFYTDSPEGDTLLEIRADGRRQSKTLAFQESLCTEETKQKADLAYVWLCHAFSSLSPITTQTFDSIQIQI